MTAIRTRRVLLMFALGGVMTVPAIGLAQRVVYEVRSQYQLITVQDTAGGSRQLVFDQRFPGTGALQSEMSLANHDELTVTYTRYIMAALPLVASPRHLLIVGLGGASMQRYLRKLLPDATIETVELDPAIRDVATKFFFFREDARQVVRIGDGRRFLERSRDRYDAIFLDAFNAASIPHALSTEEFLREVSGHLAEGGAACANVWNTSREYPSMLATYAAVFPELHVLNCRSSGNSIVVALRKASGLTVPVWMDKARAFERDHPTGLDLPALVEQGAARLEPFDGARVLRDADEGH